MPRESKTIDSFLTVLGLFNLILFVGFALSTYTVSQENKTLKSELLDLKTQHNIEWQLSLAAIAQNAGDMYKNQNELGALKNRVSIVEESIDPKNAMWAKTKLVRDVVRITAEQNRYELGFKRTEDLTSYAASVVRWSEEYDVPISLALAVTRRESAFQPKIISHAGAIGLMQVMPETGREIAGDIGYRRFKPEHLKKIKVNTQFGIYYLSKMLDEFDRNVGLAIRAYNCGPTYTHKVIAGEFSDYPEETREYARIILGDEETEGYIKYYENMGL